MNTKLHSLLTCLLLSAALSLSPVARAQPSELVGKPLPAFTHRDAAAWLNSPPLRVGNLHGKVVLIDVWAFECWNCYRSFPWLDALRDRLAPQGLVVIGVHSPELPREYSRDGLIAAAKHYDLRNPILIDNDHSYWRALGNEYWPAFYVVDKSGTVRGAYIGETHPGDANALRIEAQIRALLKESG